MKKKLSKESLLKHRIAELESNYADLDRQNDRLRDELRVFKEKEERNRFSDDIVGRLDNIHNAKLIDIIRWLINPETAKSPSDDELRKMRSF
jgi:hypothetical protein